MRIEVKTSFISFHCWPTAPVEVSFLQNPHRHVFHVVCRFDVVHADRDLEFFIMQQKINNVIGPLASDLSRIINWSCEKWAEEIAAQLPNVCYVSVHEDGENGAILTIEEDV